MAGQRLHRGEARTVGQLAGGQPGEEVDLDVERLEQTARRGDPRPRRRGQRGPVQQLIAPDSEHVAHRHGHALIRQHRMDLAAQAGAQVHQSGAVANQTAQLPRLRRRVPRPGETVHAQQISKVMSVSFVIPHPPVVQALHAERAINWRTPSNPTPT
jgi:hypothetical protein